MKKNKILLLIIVLFLPSLVKAYDYKDLDFKWKIDVDLNQYVDFQSLGKDGNPESILVNNYLYTIFTEDEIIWIDKLTGQLDEYYIYGYNIEKHNNNLYVFGQQDEEAHLLKLNEKNLIEKKVILENQEKHSLFIKDEKIIAIAYKQIENTNYEYYVNIYDKELNHIDTITTTLPQYVYSNGDLNYSFSCNYNKYYYLNKEYKIVPYIVEENGNYTVFDGSILKIVDKDADVIKEYSITKNYTYQDGKIYKESKGKKYILAKEKESAGINTYNSYATLYVFDNNLNLLTKKIVGTKNNHSYSYGISSYMYLNGDRIIIKVENNYYEVDNSYNLIQTTSDNAKNTFELSFEDKEDDYYYNDYENYERIDYELKAYGTENITEKDLYYNFDYIKYKNNYYASVTWTYECSKDEINRIHTCYTHDDLIVLDSKFNIVNAKEQTAKEMISERDTSYNFEARNNIIREFNGYIIASFGGVNRNSLKVYNDDLSVFKNFDDIVSESMYLPRAIVHSKNGFLLINKKYTPPPKNISSDITRITDKEKNTEIYYFEFPYEISTKVTGNGVVEIETEKSRAGENIKFVVTPEKGYVLEKVKVTDSDGNVLIFTNYEFTMPTADVIIEAYFIPEKIDNPITSDSIVIISAVLLMLFFNIKYFKKTKNNLS